jgi:hypothetical protein
MLPCNSISKDEAVYVSHVKFEAKLTISIPIECFGLFSYNIGYICTSVTVPDGNTNIEGYILWILWVVLRPIPDITFNYDLYFTLFANHSWRSYMEYWMMWMSERTEVSFIWETQWKRMTTLLISTRCNMLKYTSRIILFSHWMFGLTQSKWGDKICIKKLN